MGINSANFKRNEQTEVNHCLFSPSFFYDDSLLPEVDQEEVEPALDWLMDCPIFIAAFLASQIAFLTASASEGCRSLSLRVLSSASAFSICQATSVGILLLNSSSCLLVVSQTPWASFLRSMMSLLFLSSSLNFSASLSMRSMSSLESPPELWMMTVWSLPVDLSLALTWTMPLASMSKETQTWGTPRGAGGMPARSNWPSSLLSATISLSPWNTLMVTVVWLSAAVEKTCDFLVGMVVFLGIILVMTPPRVSIPRERGVTSSRSRSFMLPCSTPPWMAAPTATASSGFTDLLGVFQNIFCTISTTLGMRVIPPTKMTSSILFLGRSASLMQFSQGLMVLLRKSSVRDYSLALVSLKMKCLGPEASAVRKGRLTSV